LNQYAQRTVPGSIDVMGTSDATATVTVNNQATYRRGSYFQTTLTFDNLANAVSSQVNVVGVKQNSGPNGEDAVEQKNGGIFLPTAVESYGYDLDGNLLTDGRWQYTWDAENRLTSMTALAAVPAAAKKKLEFAYDYLGRRIQKKVYSWNAGTSAYDLQSTTKFVYDGWNVIAELDGANALSRNYVWGTDLSGTWNEAGGVGGLLMITDSTGTHQVGYDGNGNVTALFKASNGTVEAAYDYDPFGNTLQETGTALNASPFRYSTKYTDSETNLVYYGRRYYNPQTGRFINRDPIEETGGMNLYGFVNNNPANKIDQLGMYEIDVHYYLTYFLARKVGCFTEHEVRLIADADQATDENPATSPGLGKGLENTVYHALHEGAQPGHGATDLWASSLIGATNYVGLGRYMHYFQDTYSHAGFPNNTYGHAFGTHKTDKTATAPGKTLEMARTSFEQLSKWAKAKGCLCANKWDYAWGVQILRFANVETNHPSFSTIDANRFNPSEFSLEFPPFFLGGDHEALRLKARILGVPMR
jgi:RHS repeat-associated protein